MMCIAVTCAKERNKMLKVLVDGIVYGMQKHGGVSRCFTEVLASMAAVCPEVRIILHLPVRYRSKPLERTHIRLVHDLRLWPQRLQSVFANQLHKLGRRKAMRHKPDIFHSTYYTMPYDPKLPSVVTVHDMIHERFPALLGASAFPLEKRRIIEAADAVIAVSETTKRDLLKYIPIGEEKITVTHHAPNPLFTHPAKDEEIERFLAAHKLKRPYWLCVGDRNGYKNFGTVVRALPGVLPEVDGQILAIGGDSRLLPWEMDFVVRHRMEKRIKILQDIDDDQLRLAYNAASGLVLPSLAEGFGIPIVEAMAAGTPVMCSDIPIFREVAGQAAVFFDPHNANEVAQRMLEVLDPDVRDRCIQKGREWVKRYSWAKAAAKTAAVYKDLVRP